MKKLSIILICSLFLVGNVLAGKNIPKVPSTMVFAGIKLKINKSAQAKIQKHVNDLRYSDKYFQRLVDKADIYFPIIEKAFAEENFPDDIKYLIIQESAFQASAVSSSKAVGYWQFKAPTAREIGLRVDSKIDERKNIEASSKAAARYMTKNNKRLDNWVYAIISYNTGLGGVMKYYKSKDKGVKQMEITQRTHWYALKCIAHKIAYQDAVHKKNPTIDLTSVVKPNSTLKKIAKEYNISLDLLTKYNKWISPARTIPSDKNYTIAVPLPYKEKVPETIADTTTTPTNNEPVVINEPIESGEAPTTTTEVEEGEEKKKDPIKIVTQIGKDKITTTIEELKELYKINRPIIINGVPGVTAKYNDNAQRLAMLGGISKKKFLKYNELKSFEKITPGDTYYFKRKKNKAKASFHVVKEGETLWGISQQYGINLWAIRSKNRMKDTEALRTGRVLWLRKYRPESTPVEYKKVSTPSPNNSNSVTHTVTKGDTLFSISRKYDVSVEDIKKLNNLSDNGISIGSVLIIK